MAGKHSLWLMPEGAEFERLSALIQRLAATYSTPVFPPHITLAGGIRMQADEIMATAQRLAAETRAFTAIPGGIGREEEYYRCLYLRIAETDAVMHANKAALEAFGLMVSRPFMPHLSLIYCNMPDHRKEEIVKTLKNEIFSAFDVTSLYVYETDGSVEKWSCTGRFPLG